MQGRAVHHRPYLALRNPDKLILLLLDRLLQRPVPALVHVVHVYGGCTEGQNERPKQDQLCPLEGSVALAKQQYSKQKSGHLKTNEIKWIMLYCNICVCIHMCVLCSPVKRWWLFFLSLRARS